ncbi:YihY/virulence factor BrkB family protein [Nocardioides caldifontis]|uniref:YihY/virulence factor BrkB family protein n=1 Tax=Nocardioides caldifontis TaxID=2588938 RepID=UPI001EF0E17F|nr:YihY/virulence factor BrkB family protein [Nocardioides caldifontis]
MAAGTDRDAAGPAPGGGRPDLLRAAASTVWRLVVSTVGTCMRYRVTGLAAEAAFFALLSLPPLIFGLTGSIGYVVRTFTDQRIGEFREDVVDLARQAFTEDIVDTIIVPTMNDVLSGPRYDVISIGFVLALWSGSRALNVFVDTVTIMYGLGGHRGIVKTRVLSFSLYVLGLVTGIVALPLVVAGPGLVDKALPERLDGLNALYWPAVVLICVVFTATLYHVSVPVRTSWRYNLPGAVLTLFVWITGSAVLRWFLTASAGESTSIYGPLATPIAVMIWLYILAIAVLIGAALNAAFDEVWPEAGVALARIELMRRLRRSARRARRRRTTAAAPALERDLEDDLDDLDDGLDGRIDEEETVVLRRDVAP